MNDIEVLRITRRGADAVLFVETPIEPGTEVLQKVDWIRRFDHMQQHSGIVGFILHYFTYNDVWSWVAGWSGFSGPAVVSGPV